MKILGCFKSIFGEVILLQSNSQDEEGIFM